jgi:uncharacterized membrane protein YGL010W
MKTYQDWMSEYGVSHQNPTNQLVHKICVPLIMFSVLGLLWIIPVPASWPAYLNVATIVSALALAFYFSLHPMMGIGMVFQASIMLSICHAIAPSGLLLPLCIGIFVLAWIGQFWGHKIEGKKPSFLQDLVFLLIGPLWVMRFLYARLGYKV